MCDPRKTNSTFYLLVATRLHTARGTEAQGDGKGKTREVIFPSFPFPSSLAPPSTRVQWRFVRIKTTRDESGIKFATVSTMICQKKTCSIDYNILISFSLPQFAGSARLIKPFPNQSPGMVLSKRMGLRPKMERVALYTRPL